MHVNDCFSILKVCGILWHMRTSIVSFTVGFFVFFLFCFIILDFLSLHLCLWNYLPGNIFAVTYYYYNAKLVHILCLLFHILGLMSYDPRFFHCSYFYPFCRMQDLFSGQMRCLLMLLSSIYVLHCQKMESHLFQRFLSFPFPYFLLYCQISRHIWRCRLRYVLHLLIDKYLKSVLFFILYILILYFIF